MMVVLSGIISVFSHVIQAIRNKDTISLLSFAVVFTMAGVNMPVSQSKKTREAKANVIVIDMLLKGQDPKNSKVVNRNIPDTVRMDSLQSAIYHHNKAIDDSIRTDSVMRARSDGIDASVGHSAEDSLVYNAESGTAYLYGNSKVDHENTKLTSDKAHMNFNKSTVCATGAADSTTKGGTKRKPVFTIGKGEHKNDTMTFNFKSGKGLVRGIYIEQQDGFLSGEVGKHGSTGSIYLQHGRYTIYDKAHPDFYIALSRAEVRPDKDVTFGPAYLVVADVLLPSAIPYNPFPFSKKYSSGFIILSHGDESDRSFYLHSGGCYFTVSDKWDSEFLGEIYAKGSWGVSVAGSYRKRYRYSDSFLFSYQDSKTDDKGLPDFVEQESSGTQ